MNKQPKMKPRGLSAVPSVVQLPGGRTLQAIPFKITGTDEEGRAKTFEILPRGTDITKDPAYCALFAEEGWIRGRQS